jgi:hypothetical protein
MSAGGVIDRNVFPLNRPRRGLHTAPGQPGAWREDQGLAQGKCASFSEDAHPIASRMGGHLYPQKGKRTKL